MTTLPSDNAVRTEPPHHAAMPEGHPVNRETETPLHPETKNRRPGAFVFALVILTVVAWAGWHFFGQAKVVGAHDTAAAAPGPVPVGVQTVSSQTLRLWNDFSGRLRAVDAAEIRPEVSGRITEVRFQDGQSVKAGDILVVIDPRIYEATVARAEARITAAKATLQLTNTNSTRDASLLKTKAISQREFDQTDSANNSAQAELLTAQADLKTAQVDVDHAYVKAPISGRVSRAELTVGNLVQSGAGAPLLLSIVSENGIYADFEVDEQTYLETIRDAANGNAQEAKIPVEVVTPGDAGKNYKGFVQNFDNRLDPASGTIRARAKFPNTDRSLVPGMFVSVRLASSREQDLLVIADQAIGYDQSKKFVYVVSPLNKVIYREVELGHELGGQRVVRKGLAAGDRIVVDGLQRVRADAVVVPKEVAPVAPAAVDTVAQTAQADKVVQPKDSIP